ncbi:hypothetical protein CDSM653_02331 [Caldanaerobacter subterraneus subsp. pacificus DSM 12653]|uniref:Uncharacterized protein n=1 Tax=Caldanaerobacter subterraneus subsp. pacificus DSM 12653 TaxID=391606 RepID=A0A0F5PJW2_9THEO|nr:hypothetical protein CDSM653_02331 [Caldanaerobacter subterraneus subsp. pacificus DSM 12653]
MDLFAFSKGFLFIIFFAENTGKQIKQGNPFGNKYGIPQSV